MSSRPQDFVDNLANFAKSGFIGTIPDEYAALDDLVESSCERRSYWSSTPTDSSVATTTGASFEPTDAGWAPQCLLEKMRAIAPKLRRCRPDVPCEARQTGTVPQCAMEVLAANAPKFRSQRLRAGSAKEAVELPTKKHRKSAASPDRQAADLSLDSETDESTTRTLETLATDSAGSTLRDDMNRLRRGDSLT
ncbi:unnamed protein product [Ixodes persulcatus]